jgi:MinD-like ATPase involved in chromosome partitioning or flagellar assembly
MSDQQMEIIAVTSGKGGTGKTIVSACLGYALTRAGHRVLIVDADLATDGLSLFLLGPEGINYRTSIRPESTFANVLVPRTDGRKLNIRAFQINRGRDDDHGVIYQALISSTGLYGDSPPPLIVERDQFRQSVSALFRELEERGDFDYVIVDTRGGFSFETTDVCALAHSFIVVTEADYTSFYQARNLVREISAAAQQLDLHPVLRSIFVNKALEVTENTGRLDLSKMEVSFRLELVKEFEQTGIRFEDTHPVPLDAELLWAYKTQHVPLRHAPAYKFSFAVLNAFAQILRVVTSPWERAQAEEWNRLVDSVSAVIKERNTAAEAELAAAQQRREAVGRLEGDVTRLQDENRRLEREVAETRERYQRELTENRETLERRHRHDLEDRATQHERELARAQEAQAALRERELAEARARSELELAQARSLYEIQLSNSEANRLRDVDVERRRVEALEVTLAGTQRMLSLVRIAAAILGLIVLAVFVVAVVNLLRSSPPVPVAPALTPTPTAQVDAVRTVAPAITVGLPTALPAPSTAPSATTATVPTSVGRTASPAIATVIVTPPLPLPAPAASPAAQSAPGQSSPAQQPPDVRRQIEERLASYFNSMQKRDSEGAWKECCTPAW